MRSVAISEAYDWRLIGLSLVIVMGASYSAFELARRIAASNRSWLRAIWLSCGALAMGSGIRAAGLVDSTVSSAGVSSLGIIGVIAIALLLLALSLATVLAHRRLALQKRLVRAEQQRWLMVMSASRDGLFDFDLVAGTLFQSPRNREMLGFDHQQQRDPLDEWVQRMHPDDQKAVSAALAQYFKSREGVFEMEYRLCHPDGSYRRILGRAQAVWDTDGKPLRLVGSNSGILEIKKAPEDLNGGEARFNAALEHKLRASESRCRELFQQNPLPSWIYRPGDLQILDVNEAAILHYGWARAEFLSLKLSSIPMPDEVEAEAELQECAETHRTTKPRRHLRKDGSEIWVELCSHDIEFDGCLARLLMASGVTARIAAENEAHKAHELLEKLVAQRTHALQTTETKWRLLVEALPQFVWSCSADGQCDYMSNQWSAFTGVPVSELLGIGWLETIHIDDHERVELCWRKAQINGEPYEQEYRIRSRGGTYRWYVSRGRPVRAVDNGPIIQWLGTSTDIEDQKRSEERLEQAVAERTIDLAEARDRAECAAEAKSLFLAAMSHEIRTPMNGVLGMTSLLLETPLNSAQRCHLDTIRSSGEALLAIINDILDFSKIEAGKMELDTVEFDLTTLLEESLELMNSTAVNKGLRTSLVIEDNIPIMAQGDAGRLRQILLNLLSNAVKFTHIGSVSLSVSLTAMQDQVMMLRFAVQDTGIGMSAEQRAGLFEAFSQADRSTTRRFGGSGLGLSIAKRLVELMGGTIGVSSREGHGSTFWFHVCLAPGAPLPAASPAHKKILLLANHSDRRDVLRQYLHRARIPVCEWDNSAEDSAGNATNCRYSLIVVDVSDLNSTEAIERLKTTLQLRPCPALVLGTPADWPEERLPELAVADYLPKPTRCAQLVRAIRVTLKAKPQPVATLASNGLAPLSTNVSRQPATPQLGKAGGALKVLLVEDNPVNQMVASLLLEQLGYQVELAHNGREGCAAAEKTAFDLILMDCQMPEMDGFEATRVIRQREGGKRHTPIIAFTAGVLKEDRAECLEAGMDDFLAKPVSHQQLKSVLENWSVARAAPMETPVN